MKELSCIFLMILSLTVTSCGVSSTADKEVLNEEGILSVSTINDFRLDDGIASTDESVTQTIHETVADDILLDDDIIFSVDYSILNKPYTTEEKHTEESLLAGGITYYEGNFEYNIDEVVETALTALNRERWRANALSFTDEADYHIDTPDPHTYAVLYNGSSVAFLAQWLEARQYTSDDIYFLYFSSVYDGQLDFYDSGSYVAGIDSDYFDSFAANVSKVVNSEYQIVKIGTLTLPEIYKPELTNFTGKDELIQRAVKMVTGFVKNEMTAYNYNFAEGTEVDCYIGDFDFYDDYTKVNIICPNGEIIFIMVGFLNDYGRPLRQNTSFYELQADTIMYAAGSFFGWSADEPPAIGMQAYTKAIIDSAAYHFKGTVGVGE